MSEKKWYVYIVKCKDGSLYSGITTDIFRREREHNEGRGAKYTKGRTPVKLQAHVGWFTRSAALKVEAMVKRLPPDQKIKFVDEYEVTVVELLMDLWVMRGRYKMHRSELHEEPVVAKAFGSRSKLRPRVVAIWDAYGRGIREIDRAIYFLRKVRVHKDD